MQTTITKQIYNLMELENFCLELRPIIFSKPHSISCLHGEIGAGKTTFIGYLLQGLIKSNVNSPTFNIVNIYEGYNGEKYLHFDLYRKDDMLMEDLREIGMDLLYDNPNNHCFIEWPQRFIDIKKYNDINIFIKNVEDFRKITLNI